MKKWLILCMLVVVLVGCSDDRTSSPESTETNQDTTIGITEPKVDVVENTDSTEDASDLTQNQDLEGYEEYQILTEKIDLLIYQAEINTDNPGNRVILFMDSEGNKTYKSIYNKHDAYLKIIKLDDDGLFYNGKVN